MGSKIKELTEIIMVGSEIMFCL